MWSIRSSALISLFYAISLSKRYLMKGVANAKRYETQVPTIIASRTFSSLANRYLLVISGSQNKKITVEEAIEAYTLTSAYASFEDHIKGSIVPGKRADMIVLSEDLLTVPTNDIRNVEVLYTIVGGEGRLFKEMISN